MHARISRHESPRHRAGLRPHDRQLRRCAPRPPGHAGAAALGGPAPRVAVVRADVRAASARLFRCGCRQTGTGADTHRHAARQARRAGTLRHRPDRGAALRRAFRGAAAADLHRRRVVPRAGREICAGRRRLPLRRETFGRLRDARRRRPGARLRRRAHEQLRGARRSRIEFRRARGADGRRHGARRRTARAPVQRQRPCRARAQARA